MFVKRGLLLSTLGFRDCHWQSFHPPVNFLFFSTSSSVIGDLEYSVEVIMSKFSQLLFPFVKIIDWLCIHETSFDINFNSVILW